MKTDTDRLKELYAQPSKHSNYQMLSKKLSGIINEDEIKVTSRYENERLAFILDSVEIKDAKILDIGGNSGFFSFELLDRGAKCVCYYEGNPIHSEFVEIAAEALHISDKLIIYNKYFNFDSNIEQRFNITLLLNVLHHIGDDYGDNFISISDAKKEIIRQLNLLAKCSEIIVFQLGFNWKGERNTCLFKNGTKTEMISYIKEGVKDYWDILTIGIADNIDGEIRYQKLNDFNIKRFDSMGEFLNRPIFIMKSKVLDL